MCHGAEPGLIEIVNCISRMGGGSSKAVVSGDLSTSRRCGYEYMTPSYVLDEQLDEAARYPLIADALLENSSAHGLPTLYRAQGDHSVMYIQETILASFSSRSRQVSSLISPPDCCKAAAVAGLCSAGVSYLFYVSYFQQFLSDNYFNIYQTDVPTFFYCWQNYDDKSEVIS